MSFPPGRTRAMHTSRAALVRFLVLVPFLVVLPLGLRLRWGGSAHPGFDFACLVALEWTPALAAWLALGSLFPGNLGLGPPRSHVVRSLIVAILAPLAVAVASYGAAWASGNAPFTAPVAPAWVGTGLVQVMAFSIVHHLSRGFGGWLLLALGEEIGWRGFLALQLKRADLPLPMLAGGLIWSSWHWPAMLWGDYPAGPDRMLSLVLLTVTLTSFAYPLAALRLATGSVWPAVLSHALWNSFFFDSFEGATRASTLWTRESGVLTAAASILVAALSFAALAPAVRAAGSASGWRRSTS